MSQKTGDPMMTKRTTGRIYAGLIAVVLLLTLAPAQAAEVSAQLTSAETSVGVPVQLKIQIEGSTNAYPPQQIEVEGLQIQPTGQERRVEIQNFRMTSSVVYNYTVLPNREGTFEIPSVEVNIDGKKIRTQPLELSVRAGIARPAPSLPGGAPAVPGNQAPTTVPEGESELAFAEMIVPKESAYVGEMVPVELRFFFNQGVPFRIQDRPTFSGEGFTVEKLSEPLRGEQLIGDTPYHVFTFQTAITAVKSGELEIPAVSLRAIASVPSRGPAGFEDMFTKFFGNSGMPGFSDDRELAVTSEPQKLVVKPLPRDGRPEDFSGAIGDFTMTAGASPDKAGSGDPITLALTVSGRGNFSAMGPPGLVNSEGWRLYPPAERFEPADTVGYGGTKVYENMIVAQEVKTETPGARFVYFDPAKADYVTLTTDPIPVEAAAADRPVTTTTAAADATPEATAEPAAPEDARSGVLAHTTPRTFESLINSQAFLGVNGVALLALLGFFAFQLHRRAQAGEAARMATLRKQEARLLQEIARPDLDEETFFSQARVALDCQARRAGFESGEAYVAERDESASTEGLRLLLARADEAKFSGSISTGLSVAERTNIIEALREAGR